MTASDGAAARKPRPGGDLAVLLVRPLATGGLAAHVDHELRLLRAAGLTVHESTVQIPARPHPATDLRSMRTLRGEARAHRPDAVHAHGLRAGALAALALLGRGRLVVTLHNRTLGSRGVRLIGRALLRIIARRAETILCVSPDLLEDARAAGAADVRYAVVPAPEHPAAGEGDPDPAAGALPASEETPVLPEADPARLDVLVLARLAPQKGLDTVLDAAALLTSGKAGGAVRIRIAGEGPLRAPLESRIRQERLPVELLGHRSDVPALLAAADLVVSAAVWEGQPVALQEALRAGRAIVATDAGGTRWVTGDAAQLVPVGDAAALAAAVQRHRDPRVRHAAEQASRQRASQLPTEQDLKRQLVDVLAGADRPG